jgi:hypothetical protein
LLSKTTLIFAPSFGRIGKSDLSRQYDGNSSGSASSHPEIYRKRREFRHCGAAAGIKSQIAAIDVVGTIAAVRLEIDNWSGSRFTDLFTLLELEWRVEDHEQGLPPPQLSSRHPAGNETARSALGEQAELASV